MASPLGKIQAALTLRKRGEEWEGKCPAHDDDKPSLRVREADRGGKLLVKCHAGCTASAVMGALGLDVRDLFPEGEELPQAKRIVAEYDYRDEAERLLFQVVRYEPKDFRQRRPSGGAWDWKVAGVRHVLFRLPEVVAAVRAGTPVCLAEGEKAALALAAAGLCGTCSPGGAGKWHPDFAEPLKGARCVLLPDNDATGRNHMEQVAASLLKIGAEVRLLQLAGVKEKGDVWDWLHGTGTAEELRTLVNSAPVWERKADTAEDTPAKGSFWHKNFDVERLEKIMTEPPIYYVYVYGGKVKMTGAELLAFPQFKRIVSDALHRVPDMRNPNLNWHPYLDECFQTRMEIVDAPEEASPDAMTWYQVARYLTTRADEDEAALAEYRGPYSNERFLYFHGPTLHRWLNGRGLQVKPADLWDVLRRHGASARLKKVRDSKGLPQVVRAWLVEKQTVGQALEEAEELLPLTDDDGPVTPGNGR